MPYMKNPTEAQQRLIPAILSPRDVILRAHTGSGKSLAVLLSLLAKPRMLFRAGSASARAGTSALILVPSNELAWQYVRWAQELMPASLHGHLDAVLQCVVRGESTLETQVEHLRTHPPHIVVGTATRVQEILALPQGKHILGVPTLRTLVLDEADALLQLPGRFPSEKQKWKHLAHRSAGLDVLNTLMRSRPTFSGGERIMNAGLERGQHTRATERRPPERIRRTQYRGVERTDLAPPLPHEPGMTPLQLVCTSATANSVLRHFFGARTGWLRTNTRETRGLATWIDLTGMSGRLSEVDVPMMGAMPREITHTCVVVDEGPAASPVFRPLAPERGAPRALASTPPTTKPLPEHEVDTVLLEALAYIYAAEGIRRGLALIPARWSVRRVHDELASLGVSVRIIQPGDAMPVQEEDEVLYLLQSTSARGLDVPALSHVFLLGLAAVQDAVHYTHAAGRVSRLGATSPTSRPPGHVVTLLRGDATSESKMARIYARVHITPRALDLRT
ncbi:rRNA processing protein [Malassezia pachydermatis]